MTLLTAAQVATQLAVSRRMVYDLVGSGTLPVVRIGGALRFDPNDIEAFVAACRVPARTKPATRIGVMVPTTRLEDGHAGLVAMFRRAGVTPRTDPSAPVRQGRRPKARPGGR